MDHEIETTKLRGSVWLDCSCGWFKNASKEQVEEVKESHIDG